MLDLDMSREPAPPRDAATLVLLKDSDQGLLVFCVERHKKSHFLGGALVFPGGKLDPKDHDEAFAGLTVHLPALRDAFARDEAHLRALAVAALRETLEEAAILPVTGGTLTHDALLALRAELAEGSETLAGALTSAGLSLDLARLRPFARWITPVAEGRRYDTRFFLALAPAEQPGAHDQSETTASFWASPGTILERFLRGEVQLAPPTHRTLQLLAELPRAEDALTFADASSLLPICPRVVPQPGPGGDTIALVLPGDPEHPDQDVRVPGLSRYVLREGKFVPEPAPPGIKGE